MEKNEKQNQRKSGKVSYNPGGIPANIPGYRSPIDVAAESIQKSNNAANEISPAAMEELVDELE
jgi:hypothetical protein